MSIKYVIACLVDVVLMREREKFNTSIQSAWLMRTDLCSCLGHLQHGCEAMADSLLVLMPHEHRERTHYRTRTLLRTFLDKANSVR